MPSRAEMPGKTFGRLTVLSLAYVAHPWNAMWLCRCECGNTKVIANSSLVRGATRSCGCLLREVSYARCYRHGRTRTPEHKAWQAMLRRCKPGSATASLWGDRGITVCDRWRSFKNFLADMGPKPPGTSLDRIDNGGNYEPSNCRWATKLQQANNTRTNRRCTYEGETLTLAEWAERTGFPYNLLRDRIHKGWPIEEAINIPPCGPRSYRDRPRKGTPRGIFKAHLANPPVY
jgi:hypothetical protein